MILVRDNTEKMTFSSAENLMWNPHFKTIVTEIYSGYQIPRKMSNWKVIINRRRSSKTSALISKMCKNFEREKLFSFFFFFSFLKTYIKISSHFFQRILLLSFLCCSTFIIVFFRKILSTQHQVFEAEECVCVCEREREREREKYKKWQPLPLQSFLFSQSRRLQLHR